MDTLWAEQVLAMDDLTESEDEMPPLIDDLAGNAGVDVVVFPNLQNLQPLVVEEVPLEELAAFEDLAPNEALAPPPQFDNVQLGFVETFFPVVDPILQKAATSGPSPDAIRLWAKYFDTVDPSLPTATIPTQNFFTLIMLKQSSFEWAKDFLQSRLGRL